MEMSFSQKDATELGVSINSFAALEVVRSVIKNNITVSSPLVNKYTPYKNVKGDMINLAAICSMLASGMRLINVRKLIGTILPPPKVPLMALTLDAANNMACISDGTNESISVVRTEIAPWLLKVLPTTVGNVTTIQPEFLQLELIVRLASAIQAFGGVWIIDFKNNDYKVFLSKWWNISIPPFILNVQGSMRELVTATKAAFETISSFAVERILNIASNAILRKCWSFGVSMCNLDSLSISLEALSLDDEFTTPSTSIKNGSRRCGKCNICKYVCETSLFTSTRTRKTYPIISLLDCGSRNVIYLASCNKCQAQYIGRTTQPFRKRALQHLDNLSKEKRCGMTNHMLSIHPGVSLGSMPISFTIIDKSLDAGNELNKMEKMWMEKMDTLGAGGMNLIKASQ